MVARASRLASVTSTSPRHPFDAVNLISDPIHGYIELTKRLSLEVELTRRNVPFVKFGGLKFLEAAHIKDVLAFLRWTQNPCDRVAGFRTIQLLPGVGPKTAARLLDCVTKNDAMQAIAGSRSERTPGPRPGNPRRGGQTISERLSRVIYPGASRRCEPAGRGRRHERGGAAGGP